MTDTYFEIATFGPMPDRSEPVMIMDAAGRTVSLFSPRWESWLIGAGLALFWAAVLHAAIQ